MYDIADCETNIYNTHMTNVSRKKGDQRMKSDHLIEFDMRNIFLEKSCKNVVEKLVLDTFAKNKN